MNETTRDGETTMASKTGASMRREAARLGATVEGGRIGRWYRFNVDAPAGNVWAASSTHTLVVEWRADESGYREESIADVLERMAEGLAACDDEDCEICHGH